MTVFFFFAKDPEYIFAGNYMHNDSCIKSLKNMPISFLSCGACDVRAATLLRCLAGARASPSSACASDCRVFCGGTSGGWAWAGVYE